MLDQGLAKKTQENKGKRALLCKPRALLCKPSRDVDSRKLTLAVMLDQGLAKKTQETKEKGHCYANQVVMWVHANHSWQSR